MVRIDCLPQEAVWPGSRRDHAVPPKFHGEGLASNIVLEICVPELNAVGSGSVHEVQGSREAEWKMDPCARMKQLLHAGEVPLRLVVCWKALTGKSNGRNKVAADGAKWKICFGLLATTQVGN